LLCGEKIPGENPAKKKQNMSEKHKSKDDLPVGKAGMIFGGIGFVSGILSLLIFGWVGWNFIAVFSLILLAMGSWIFGWWYKLKWLKTQKHSLYKDAKLEFQGNAAFYLAVVAGFTTIKLFVRPEMILSTNQIGEYLIIAIPMLIIPVLIRKFVWVWNDYQWNDKL